MRFPVPKNDPDRALSRIVDGPGAGAVRIEQVGRFDGSDGRLPGFQMWAGVASFFVPRSCEVFFGSWKGAPQWRYRSIVLMARHREARL